MGGAENFDFNKFMEDVKADSTLDRALAPEEGHPRIDHVSMLVERVKAFEVSGKDNPKKLISIIENELKNLREMQNAVPKIITEAESMSLNASIARLVDARERVEKKIH